MPVPPVQIRANPFIMEIQKKTIITRRKVDDILEDIDDEKLVVFSDRTEFISRTAADEFLHQANKNNLTLDLENASVGVKKMFNALISGSEREIPEVIDSG